MGRWTKGLQAALLCFSLAFVLFLFIPLPSALLFSKIFKGLKIFFQQSENSIWIYPNCSTSPSVLEYLRLSTGLWHNSIFPLCRVEIVRTYVAFLYNNLYRTSPLPTDLWTLLTLVLRPLPGQKWNCFTHSDMAYSMWDFAWCICDRHPTDTGCRSLLCYVSCSCNELPTPWWN